MVQFAKILITKDERGHLTAEINSDIGVADLLLGFALLQQQVIQGKTQNKKNENITKASFDSIDERLKKK